MRFLFYSLILSVFLTGCMGQYRIKGGKISHVSPVGSQTVATQSDDPKTETKIASETSSSREIIIPAGSKLVLESSNTVTSVNLSSNTVYKEVITEKFNNSLGSAQENVAAKVGALLSGMRPVMFAGILVMLLGAATLHPKLKLVLGFSNTQSFIVMAGGLVLTFLPMIFVQYGHIIVIGTLLAVAGYIFVYRYSSASTKAKIYKDFIDKNENGVDDRDELTK